MKVPELVAVPSGVVIPIFPVFAPLGTVAVTFEVEFTVKVAALTPPNVTWEILQDAATNKGYQSAGRKVGEAVSPS